MPKQKGTYADEKNPTGKYRIGTRIKITKSKYKVGNGIFEITDLFPEQKWDDSFFQYTRVTKRGKLSKGKKAVRSNWGTSLDRLGKIVKKPKS